ncbi:Heterokaryon incompatibility protein 6 like [Verticillium longisporum]|nr:Heterokaryon incompatibility protein 6 like [Verticillium longisporum]
MATVDANLKRVRRMTLVSFFVGQLLGHIGSALLGWVLDSITFKISRFWIPLLCVFAITNGRLAIFLGLIGDWIIGTQDTTFVFSLIIFFAYAAQPLVFPDLDLPATEMWYEHAQRGPLTLPTFVISSILFHYPRGSVAFVKDGFHKAVTDPPSIGQLMDWFWVALACASVPHIIYTKLWRSHLLRLLTDVTWRFVGKFFYDLKTSFDLKIRRGSLPASGEDLSRPFEHPPLQNDWDIRLLYILPRGNSSKISCKLITIDIGQRHPTYQAMSYTWGDPTKTHTIWVNDKPFKTTQNVYNLLLDMSPVFEPRRIWIDSICINQEDNAEKAWQVSIMHHIYNAASLVTIWLGAGEDSHIAVDLVLELSHYIKTYKPTDKELFLKYVHERRTPRWLAIGKILAHPYFTRIWMVQEIAINKMLHVVYGRETIKWETLAPIILRLILSFEFSIMVEDSSVLGETNAPIGATNVVLLSSIRKRYHGGEMALSGPLLHLLAECWTFEATDPRDMVFALVGLAEDGAHPLVAPDYTKTPEEVFINAARFVYMQMNTLHEILPCSGVGWPRRLTALPSWVPDWSITGRSVIAALPKGKRAYQTSGGLVNRGPVVHEKGLEIEVIIVDKIDRMTEELERAAVDPLTYRINSTANMERCNAWILAAQALVATMSGDTYTNGQSHEEALWRTLVCDAPSVGTGELASGSGMDWPADPVYGLWYRYGMRHLVQVPLDDEDRALSPEEIHERMQLGSRWVTSAQFRCYSRRLAVTEKGYLALIPPLTEVGDMVAVIPGTAVPFILRGKGYDDDMNEKVYTLVGESYVHGLMNGEAADESKIEIVMME